LNAVVKHTSPSAKQLEAHIPELERLTLAAESERNAARSAQARLLAKGASEPERAAARRSLEAAERKLAAAITELAAGREAVEIAKAGEHRAAADELARGLEQQLTELVATATKVERATAALGESLPRLSELADQIDLTLIAGGLPPDPWAFRAKWLRTVELGLWLASDGKLGQGPPLDSAHQLRKSGAASIIQLATQYKAVVERQARSTEEESSWR
jgi:hypothetical protein